MAVKEFPAGTLLVQSEQAINALHVIAKGTVRATYPGGEFYLDKGDVIGVCELFFDSHFITYRTKESSSIASYPFSTAQLSAIIRANPDMAQRIVTSMFKQLQEILDQYELACFDCNNFYHYLMDSYKGYLSFCTKHNISARTLPGLETLSELVLEEDVAGWIGGYYSQLRKLVTETPVKEQDADFLQGLLLKASQDVYGVISVCRVLYDYKSEIINLLMSKNRLDFFDLYASLLYRIGAHADDSTTLIAAISTMMIQLESQASIDKNMYKERVAEYRERLNSLDQHTESAADEDVKPDNVPDIADSMNTILTYSKVDEETATAFRNAINQYSKLTDKNNSDDTSRKLRLTITKLFYQIYEKAFLRSLQDFEVPKVLKMFFNFGYVDEHLAGMENAAYLYSIVDRIPSDPARKVFTIYEWLHAIYEGKKTPSRNEFDTDYQAHVHELKITGKINAKEETTMLKDREKQVLFELQNMFQSVNKITFGRISSFCPVFSEHNILKELNKSLVSADKVEQTFNQVRSVDFSAYYRDMVYTNPKLGIGKEYVSVEILPDLILMPNVGVRGVMWQEIEGRKRTTPSRMMISIFQMEDLTNILVRLTGDFRWEMCKRVQGARWNDISEASLTSEYFDYIQFYKKNHDLSPDAKDKIKLNMQKAKNSFKEMFIRDYISWVLFEGSGSPRLNKIARAILFTYCPFSKEIRDKLKMNPLYKDTMERYDIKLAQKIHHYDNLFQKLKNIGAEIPPEIQSQRNYLGY
ncbi:MAG: cyclic nucleotide-binding domain-containing protein [Lachnospiraceae bacterium]|nr:cyclic nucleotide-binding domain-containing protein [Lachnospiraceae bacterium]MBD5506304.1 cyclic nucleotide-binding domain-containing protein [Lachnospiraceae bacterium]